MMMTGQQIYIMTMTGDDDARPTTTTLLPAAPQASRCSTFQDLVQLGPHLCTHMHTWW